MCSQGSVRDVLVGASEDVLERESPVRYQSLPVMVTEGRGWGGGHEQS